MGYLNICGCGKAEFGLDCGRVRAYTKEGENRAQWAKMRKINVFKIFPSRSQ